MKHKLISSRYGINTGDKRGIHLFWPLSLFLLFGFSVWHIFFSIEQRQFSHLPQDFLLVRQDVLKPSYLTSGHTRLFSPEYLVLTVCRLTSDWGHIWIILEMVYVQSCICLTVLLFNICSVAVTHFFFLLFNLLLSALERRWYWRVLFRKHLIFSLVSDQSMKILNLLWVDLTDVFFLLYLHMFLYHHEHTVV